MSQTNFNLSFGRYINGSNASWATLRGASSATVGDDTDLIVCQGYSNGGYYLQRGYALFNTSTLPDNATVSSASIAIYGRDKYNRYLGAFYILGVTTDNNSSIVATDFNITNFSGEVQTLTVADASMNSSGWNNYTLTPAYVNKTGFTKYGFVQANDWTNSAPSPDDSNGNRYYFYVTTQVPVLTVTWTTPPVVTTGSATSVTAVTATLGGNITDAGGGTVSTAGVCWGTSANPTTSNSKTSTTTTSGAFTVASTGLISGVLYHYRAYVTTENSTTYGSDQTFRTIFGGNFIPFI